MRNCWDQATHQHSQRRRCGGRRRAPRARRAWLRCPWAVAGPGRASSRRAEPYISNQAPLVWRAPEGPEGLAAVPVGGGGAWPGFETTRRAKLAARTARGQAAAHGHTEQPGPTAGPSGARNTSGTARPRGHAKGAGTAVPAPCRLTQPLPRRGSGRMILSPGDGDASTGTYRPRRPLPGPPRRSGRRSRCAQGAGSCRCSAWWSGRRARHNRSSRR